MKARLGEDKDRLPQDNISLPVAQEEDSPIEIVRISVSNKDDPSLSTLTFRFWLMGPVFCIALSFINQFFYYRDSSVVIGVLVVQLISYPIGKLLERVLPSGILNPGPFNVKEHALICMCANSGSLLSAAVDIVVIQKLYYGQDFGFVYGILLVLSAQCIGYGFAGFFYDYLVKPANMIWPSVLANVVLFDSLHKPEVVQHGQKTRLQMFLLGTALSCLYFFIPGYLFTFISTISFLCLVFPRNLIMQQIGSGRSGMGLLSLSLDWTRISVNQSPLLTPLWSILNQGFGVYLLCFVMLPILYYNNVFGAKTFPLIDNGSYTVTGEKYNLSRVLDARGLLDESAYKSYSEFRITTNMAYGYGVAFSNIPALMVHMLLFHGYELYSRFKDKNVKMDIHEKLMEKYPRIPLSWFLVVFAVSVGAAIFVCEAYPTFLPWWAVLLAIGTAGLFSLPFGILRAVSNQAPGLDVLSEFVGGYIFPGKPIAVAIYKVYGWASLSQCLTFLMDLKLGHYMKIPPREMFISQIIGSLLSSLVTFGTSVWLLNTVPNFGSMQGYPWTAPTTHTFYTGSIVWGVIGPARLFGQRQIYHPLVYFFLIGIILPIPGWLLARKYPKSLWKYVHWPVIISTHGYVLPPFYPVSWMSWFMVGVFFQYFVKKYRYTWYKKYNYIVSAALDSGTAIGGLICFFALQNVGIKLDWWGNRGLDKCELVAL